MPQCWLLRPHQITNNDRLSIWFDMAAESTVSISDSSRLSISPLNNIKPAFAKSLAYMPDGEKLPPYPICKLEYLIREVKKNHYSCDQEWKEPWDNPWMMNLWRKKKKQSMSAHNTTRLLPDMVNVHSHKHIKTMFSQSSVCSRKYFSALHYCYTPKLFDNWIFKAMLKQWVRER